jgi:glycosyltransferase involved in cell wall biosynthesis
MYEDNSEDNLEEIIENMADNSYNVRRHSWPWAKTREAGFAHCALQARDSCPWVMFTDIDEFLFSPRWLNHWPNSNFQCSWTLAYEFHVFLI